jgi:hypothetical protein
VNRGEIVSVLRLSLVSFTLRQYHWRHDFYSAYSPSATNKKIRKFLFIDVAIATCFA